MNEPEAWGSLTTPGEKPTQKPPPWRWYEPPRWFPAWLHRLTCTFCRGMSTYGRAKEDKTP